MTPMKSLLRSDLNDVGKDQALRSTQSTLKMQSRCQHEQAVASSVAGMGRLLCESCGHVSIKLVNEALTRPGIRKPRHEVHGDPLEVEGLRDGPSLLLSRRRVSDGRFEGGSEEARVLRPF